MFLSNRTLVLSSTLLLAACGAGPDLTPMLGTYHGSIVADAVISTNYSVTVSQADRDTIAISGADFATFEVDVMDTSGTLTSLADDGENTLSFTDGALSVVHEGADGSVTFTGSLDCTDADNCVEDTATGDDSGGDDTSQDGAATLAAGDYNGAITGPVVSADYTLTLAVVDSATVQASGQGISSFQIPLTMSGSDIKQSSTWTDGAFSLVDGSLSLTYNPQSLSFSGSRD